MEEMERRLKDMITGQYGSLKKFCEAIDMPWTTLDSILKRGIVNANITNVMKISRELHIDTESLASGRIVKSFRIQKLPDTIAAHFDGSEYTEEQLERIRAFAAFIKSEEKEKKKTD
ncbi:MAG: XRE family transcriptional regulator [Lachnospiraceae bacterium]|nr:XRE family transcriptional regulator [Lachnospiraceae bacterium]